MGDGSGLILGVSGLRGVVGESLTPEIAVRYAGAFGRWLLARGGDSVVVARDGRAGGEMVYHAAITGLLGAGLDVRAIDVVATPTAGLMVDPVTSGAIVVTASHNPAEWNGLKCLICDEQEQTGRAPSKDEADEIIAMFRASEGECVRAEELGTLMDVGDGDIGSVDPVLFHCSVARSRYEALVGDSEGEVRAQSMRVVLDSVNASGAEAAEGLLRLLGAHVVQLAGDGSGVFPHTPEPTRENLSGDGGLCGAVPGLNADVGFAQDPDADRLAIVDERGAYIGEEYTLVLCAVALMEARVGGEGGERRAGSPSHRGLGEGRPVFVVNLSTSRMIDDVAKRYGAEVVRTAVGEANVVEAMTRLIGEGREVLMGGEGNGGVIWPEIGLVRDSIGGMAMVLSLMSRTGKSVSELVGMVNAMGATEEVKAKGYTILKSKSGLAKKEDAKPVVAHLAAVYGGDGSARVDLQDGIRVDWDDRGVWAHVRASNTEPIMRVIVEAPSEAEARRTAEEIGSAIGSVGA